MAKRDVESHSSLADKQKQHKKGPQPSRVDIPVDLQALLDKYRISADSFNATRLDWDTLKEIARRHQERTPSLLPTAQHISERLRSVKQAHSLRLRIKDPEHLIEKIIRKKIAKPKLKITLDNYQNIITDLIGIRVLHLFKNDWQCIHDFIINEWTLREKPIANIRRGDPDDLVEAFRAKGCEIREHKLGYRSIHYLVTSQPTREVHLAEVQVRTIFEEGWSEIDHAIRYPYGTRNQWVSKALALLNRLAGGADEMGSFVQTFDMFSLEKERQERTASESNSAAIADLTEGIINLQLSKSTMAAIKLLIERIAKGSISTDNNDPELVGKVKRYTAAVGRNSQEHAVRWMRTQHAGAGGILASVVVGKYYGTQRKTPRRHDKLLVNDSEDGGLDVYDLNRRRVGRLQNSTPLDYYQFVDAMRKVYGSTPWRVSVVKVHPPEYRSHMGRLSWLLVRFQSHPLVPSDQPRQVEANGSLASTTDGSGTK